MMAERPIDAPRERVRVPTVISGESRTKQGLRDDTDVNLIVRKYRESGELPHLSRVAPRYGDFATADDYLSAMLKVKEAERLFGELPAPVRDHVRNDPAQLLAMVFDPDRVDECEALGLVSEAEPRAATAAEIGEAVASALSGNTAEGDSPASEGSPEA